MRKIALIPFIALLLTACTKPNSGPEIRSVSTSGGRAYPYGNTSGGDFLPLTQKATSSDYAYSEKFPVKAGSGDNRGTGFSTQYLNSLRGPNGEAIEYQRRGSCCPFETPNGIMGGGLLDAYVLTYKGCPKPLVIYINMYDKGDMLIPVGLTARK